MRPWRDRQEVGRWGLLAVEQDAGWIGGGIYGWVKLDRGGRRHGRVGG